MEFRILGPLEVTADGRALVIAGAKPRALLAVLLLHANQPVSAERLALALWGDDASAQAVKTIQVYVSRVRKALGDPDVLYTTPAGYGLRVEPPDLDLACFERQLAAGRDALSAGNAEVAADLLRDALTLWRGEPLAEFAWAPFAPAEANRLEELHLSAVEARVEADLAAGRHAELIAELQLLVAEQPLRERLHAQLMIALYRSGRQADALEAYRHARDVLVEQLGIEPGGELRALEQAVLAQDPALIADVGDSARGRRSRPGGRIPIPPTPTLGREADLAALRALVADEAAHLITVVGPPGVGKTRLALELARAVAPDLRDGAAFVSLAPIDTSEVVASTIAGDLDVARLPDESSAAALARHLAERELVLVLDNFEHVLDAAPLVADVLAAAPGVTVLATSREPLRIRAERVFTLDPLALPPVDDEPEAGAAVALFVAVARASDPDFALSERDAPAAVEVCRRLDGLPLAIELAAGSLGLHSVSQLAARLQHSIDALGPGARDAPSRQRTLSATLDWSYRLLSAEEQRTLEALAVFAGGCTAAAAQAVTGAAFETLEALVTKNLATTAHMPNDSVRIGMLETVREFARGRLVRGEDAAELQRRHCEHYLAFAERTLPELRRTGSPDLMTELDNERNNLRAAMRWALEQPTPVLALRLAVSLRFYMSGRRLEEEAANWLETALARDTGAVAPALRAAALDAYAHAVIETSTIDAAEAAALEGLEIRRSLGDHAGCAASLNTLCVVLLWVHRYEEAYGYAREAERLAVASGDEQALVDSLHGQAGLAHTLEESLELGERAAAADRASGNRLRLAQIQSDLSYTALIHGDHVLAQRLVDEALDAAEALDDPVFLAYAYGNSGLAAAFCGDLDRARRDFGRQLQLIRSQRHYKLIYEPMIGLAAVAAVEGHDEHAATLNGAADAATLERPHPSVAAQIEQRYLGPARARLGERSWQAAYAAGGELDRVRAIDVALRGATVVA
ncbi:MAG TPA: BTAD domain-containing putative transcriptional regulator [Solirubrobacteraceae bacterium]|nr:BTAD domain-containing putative transcriptional regulator [Solirubrobacteraceae bacterium]